LLSAHCFFLADVWQRLIMAVAVTTVVVIPAVQATTAAPVTDMVISPQSAAA
jgi:hypothetical protein